MRNSERIDRSSVGAAVLIMGVSVIGLQAAVQERDEPRPPRVVHEPAVAFMMAPPPPAEPTPEPPTPPSPPVEPPRPPSPRARAEASSPTRPPADAGAHEAAQAKGEALAAQAKGTAATVLDGRGERRSGGSRDGDETRLTIETRHLPPADRLRAMGALGYAFVLRCLEPSRERTVALLVAHNGRLRLQNLAPLAGSYRVLDAGEVAGLERFVDATRDCGSASSRMTPLMAVAACSGRGGCDASETEIGVMVGGIDRVRAIAKRACGTGHARVPLLPKAPWLGAATCD